MKFTDNTGLPVYCGQESFKESKKLKMKRNPAFQLCKYISIGMDKFYLDPILGFLFPGAFDLLLQSLTLPFLWISLFHFHSIPLTLAIIYNAMFDALLGLFPLLGDIVDIFNRSYSQNYTLLVGYVEEDKKIIKEINRNAIKSAIMIVLLGTVIYFVYLCMSQLFSWITSIFNL